MDDSRASLTTQTETQAKAEFQGISPVPFSRIGIRHHGRLPHWEKECGLYFVTFRTYGSLPKNVFEGVRQGYVAGQQLGRLRQRQLEEILDRGSHSTLLMDCRCASLVAEALRSPDHGHRLLAWCVMPNHVHFVSRLLPGVTLARVMHSLKSFTAKRINKALNRSGRVWQREYYDRLIRDSDELHRAVAYVANNPRKAGLAEWPWVEDLSGLH